MIFFLTKANCDGHVKLGKRGEKKRMGEIEKVAHTSIETHSVVQCTHLTIENNREQRTWLHMQHVYFLLSEHYQKQNQACFKFWGINQNIKK